ncbi:MAG: PQQ-binding-like beta-propeller repeat protein [Candidatus Coatesbacteria bacterium]|nr:PQQ-binding-like beta-propeller repeat protein [Candidatus Coatesbacteria bacterium]
MKTLIVILILAAAFNFLSAAPGDLLWKFPTALSFNQYSPFLYNQLIFCSTRNIYAINLDGTLEWCFKMNMNTYTSPCASDNIVISGNNFDEYIYACNATTGQLKWKKLLAENSNNFWPIIVSGKYFAPCCDRLVAINLSDGSTAWEVNESGFIFGSPTSWNNKIFAKASAGQNPAKMYSIDLSNGGIIWTYDFDTPIYSSPEVSDGIVYIGAEDKYVYAINAENKSLVWRSLTISKFSFGKPCISNSKVFIAGCRDAILYSINTVNGEILWQKQFTSYSQPEIWSVPFATDNTLYIGVKLYSDKPNIYALNTEDGSVLWSYNTGKFVFSSPKVSNGVVYIGCNDTYLYAIETYGYTGFKDESSSYSLPAKSLSISPNPFSTRLSVSLPSSGAIYSLTGQLIMKLDKGKHSLYTSSWKQGVYIVKAGKECKRIVKIK